MRGIGVDSVDGSSMAIALDNLAILYKTLRSFDGQQILA